MEMIRRTKYLEKISPFVDKPIVKVLTGMRRVGKSTILKMIQTELLSHIPMQNIISVNLESFEHLSVRRKDDFVRLIQERIQGLQGKIYYFFDEIQLVQGWEEVVNALRAEETGDIYLTGSNSSLLSGELATLLAGRYVEFEIQPFGFGEFAQLYAQQNLDKEELFEAFLKFGGMPFLKHFQLQQEPGFQYLNDVYNSVLVKDVLSHYQIRDVDVFYRILSFVIENVGHTFSATSIRNYLKSEHRDVSVDTVLNYLEYCRNAYIIKKIPRYDSLGKKILKVDEKYYLSDHGFRSARGFSNSRDIERCLENIVCIELISRGYELSVGRVKDAEIDFIAKKDGQTAYYQVSYLLETEQTRAREFGVFAFLQDNYPKYVLSMDKLNFSQNGIIHKNILDFLLEE